MSDEQRRNLAARGYRLTEARPMDEPRLVYGEVADEWGITKAAVRQIIRDLPSQSMDTLVPSTGPDVVARGDIWMAFDEAFAALAARSEPGAEGLTQEQRDYADKTIEYWVKRAMDAEARLAATPAADSREDAYQSGLLDGEAGIREDFDLIPKGAADSRGPRVIAVLDDDIALADLLDRVLRERPSTVEFRGWLLARAALTDPDPAS